MQTTEKSWTGALVLAFSTLTNMRSRPLSPDPETVGKSLFFYPLAGIYIAFSAALFPVLTALYLDVLQAFVVFTGCVYVFLLAWLSHFSGYRALCRFSDAAALGRHAAEEEDLRSALHRDTPGAAGVAACALLAASKVLIVYLLFTRLALFGRVTLLAFILVLAPFAARILMLAACCLKPAPADGPSSCAGKGKAPYVFLLVALVCAAALVFLGLMHGFGEFISLKSSVRTEAQLGKIMTLWRQQNGIFIVLAVKGIRDVGILLAGGFLTLMYAAGESKALFRGMTEEIIRAVPEIGETAFLAAGLLIADYMLF